MCSHCATELVYCTINTLIKQWQLIVHMILCCSISQFETQVTPVELSWPLTNKSKMKGWPYPFEIFIIQ